MANVSLIDLVRKFDAGVIELPLMQRDYVWTGSKVVNLLDSLYRGWPIGVFYVWKTPHHQETRAPAIKRVGERVSEEFWGYLLDGQQRLTSLSRALDGASADDLGTRAYFDVRKERFYMGAGSRRVQKRIAADDPALIPLSRLIPKTPVSSEQLQRTFQEILDALVEAHAIRTEDSPGYRARLDRAAHMLAQANPPCEVFETGDSDEDIDNAIELFKRLNKGGKTLSRGDAEAAVLTRRATRNIVPRMRAFVQDDAQRRLGLNFVFATRALITAHRDSSSFSRLPDNWASDGKDISGSWAAAERGLAAAVSLARDQMGWTSRRWLPSANALIPVTYLLRDRTGGFEAREIGDLRRYLAITALRGAFRGSVETNINTYVTAVRKAAKKARASHLSRALPKHLQRPLKPDEILRERGMYSPLMQVYFAYLVSKGARTWLEEMPLLDVAKRDQTDPLSVHHIFPRKLLRDHGVDLERINCAANYAVLSQADNASIGDADPKTIYDGLSGSAKDYADEQLFHILAERRDWIAHYDAFLYQRATAMAERLNAFLELK